MMTDVDGNPIADDHCPFHPEQVDTEDALCAACTAGEVQMPGGAR